MKTFNRILDKIIDLFLGASASICVILAILVSTDVILRKTIHFTWAPLFEITEYAIVWITFLGTVWLLREEKHIRMDVVINRLSPRTQNVLNVVVYLIAAIMMAGMTYFVIRLTVYDFQMTTHLLGFARLIKWPIESIIPISCFLIFLQCIRNILKNFNKLKAYS